MTIVDTLWRWLICSALCGSVVLILAAAVVRLVRQPASRIRLIQWALAGCLIAPWLPGLPVWKAISFPLMESRGPAKQDEVAEFTSTVIEPTAIEATAFEPITEETPQTALDRSSEPPVTASADSRSAMESRLKVQSPVGAPVTETAINPFQMMKGWIVLAYLAGVFAIVAFWIAGLWKRHSLVRSAIPPSNELQNLFAQMHDPARRPVRLLVSSCVTGPITWGLIRPVIVVPSRLVDSEDLRPLHWSLAHELSHVERGDFGNVVLALIAQLVCFYQPLFWWLRRQMNLCQDFLADSRAAHTTGTAEDYAEFLVGLATSRWQPGLPATLGIRDSKSHLSHRVIQLLETSEPLQPHCGRRVAVGSVLSAVAFLALLSTVRLDAEDFIEPRLPTANSPAVALHENVATALQVDIEAKPANDERKMDEGVLTGVVVNAADGSPVADAMVILFPADNDRTRSDAQGRFRLDRVSARPWPYSLWAFQGNLVSQKLAVRQLPGDDPNVARFAPVRIEMSAGRQATFQVFSESAGQPIRGAKVRVHSTGRSAVTTDDRGVAIELGLWPEEFNVTVEADGYARERPRIDLSQSERNADFQVILRPGGAVRGIVIDEDAKPIPKATVTYFQTEQYTSTYGDQPESNADGTFAHSFLDLNLPVRISARKQGYVPQEQQLTLTEVQRTRDVRIVMTRSPPGNSIAGVVRDMQGNPVAGAQVKSGTVPDREGEATADAEGKFVLHDLPVEPTEQDFYVTAKGFAPRRFLAKTGPRASPGTVEVSLELGHSIRGQIKLEGVDKVPNATVSVQGAEFRFGAGGAFSTDEHGMFQIDSLPAEVRFHVTVPGYPSRHGLSLALDQVAPAIVNIESPGVIRGRVVDSESKKPVSQFRVRVRLSVRGAPFRRGFSLPYEWSQPGLTFASETGEFVLEPLANGMIVELIVEKEGFQKRVMDGVVAGKRNEFGPVEFSLKRIGTERHTISGQLLDHAGQAIAGAQVRLIVSAEEPPDEETRGFNWSNIRGGSVARQADCAQFLSGVTDSAGRFEFKDVIPEKFAQLVYWGAGFPHGTSLVRDGKELRSRDGITIRLAEPARIRGKIDRSRLPDAHSVRIMREVGSWDNLGIRLLEDQADFEFSDLPAGEYTVLIESRPTPQLQGSVRVEFLAQQKLHILAGETKELHFDEPQSTAPAKPGSR